MGTIHVKELTGGLDARRLPETTPGGVLIRADNGHITRGGELEVRAAFQKVFSLGADTVGLAHTRTGFVTFGSGLPPMLPPGVRYQRLESGDRTLVNIRDWELFNDKIYAVAEFDDGSVAHFYDGVAVEAWTDTRSRVQFVITGGAITPPVQAQATIEVLSGTAEVINYIESLTVDGTELLTGRVYHTGDNATTAAALAEIINDNPTSPKYIATSEGPVLVVKADRAGAAANDRVFAWATNGNVTLGEAEEFMGGVDEVIPSINSITVDGVNIIRDPVRWNGIVGTAEAVVDAIMSVQSNPEYEATAPGTSGLVSIYAAEEGAAPNGRILDFNLTGDIQISLPDGDALAGGAEMEEDRYRPADYVLTVREKLYAGAGSILHYSAILDPKVWNVDDDDPTTVGAGFTNIASSNSSSYRITGLARYLEKLAVFTPDTIQTWFLDPDPDLFVQTQVLENTGTECPRSVTQFGDSDIFYLDTSGLRSLRARDSSNSAATTDVGVPIDDLLADKLRGMTMSQKERVTGLINPDDKRFWLLMGGEVFVYSYYPNSKVNAWTRYELTADDGTATAFEVDTALVFDRRVFIRSTSGDVYCYGGWGREKAYDRTKLIAWLPMLDANAPAAEKTWRGVDAALEGRWDVYVSYDPRRPEIRDHVANLVATTYGERRVPMKNTSTHVGLRFESRGGYARLSSLVIHFEGKVNED